MRDKSKVSTHAEQYEEEIDFVPDDEFWQDVLISAREPMPEPVPDDKIKGTSEESGVLGLVNRLKKMPEGVRNRKLEEYIENDVEAAWQLISILLQVKDESISSSVKQFVANEIDGADRTLLRHLERLLLIPENFTSDYAIQTLIDNDKEVYIQSGESNYQAFLLKKALSIQLSLSKDIVETRQGYDHLLAQTEAQEWYDDNSVKIHTLKSGFDTEQMLRVPWLEQAIKVLSGEGKISHSKLAALGLKLSKLQYEIGRVLSMIEFLKKIVVIGEQLQADDDDSYWRKAYTYKSHKTKKLGIETILNIIDLASKLGKSRTLISVQKVFEQAIPKLGNAMKYDIRTGLKRVNREVAIVLMKPGNALRDLLPGPAPVWATSEWGQDAGKEYKALAENMNDEMDDVLATLLALPTPKSTADFNLFVTQISSLFDTASSLHLQSVASQTARIMIISSKNKFFTEEGWWNESMNPMQLKGAFKDVFDGLLDFIDELQKGDGSNIQDVAERMKTYLDPDQNEKMALVNDIIDKGVDRASKYKRMQTFVVVVLAIVASIYASFAAVSLLRGGIAKLSPGLLEWGKAGFLGKATSFLSATAVEALIFEMSNQALVRMQGGEPESFGEGYAKNFAMIGLFKLMNLGMLKLYPKPKDGSFMKNLKHASAEHLAHFLFFQGWAEAMYRFEQGEWPEGVEHWEIAKENAFLLGMVKITVSATMPFPTQKIGDLTLKELGNLNRILEAKGRKLQEMYKEDAAPEDISKAAEDLKDLIDRRQRYHQALLDAEVIEASDFKATETWARDNKTALDYLKEIVKFDLKPVEGHELTFTFEGDIEAFKEFIERVGLEEASKGKGEKASDGILRYLRGQSAIDTAIVTFYQRGVLPAGAAVKNRITAKQAIEAKGIDFDLAQEAINADTGGYLNTKLRLFAEYYNWKPADGIAALPPAEQARIATYFEVKGLYPQVTDLDAVAGLALLTDQVPELITDYPSLNMSSDVLTDVGLMVWKHGQRNKGSAILEAEKGRAEVAQQQIALLLENNRVQRVGEYGDYVQEVEIAKLNKIHGAPKITKPPDYIPGLEQSLLDNGFDLSKAVTVITLPEGTLLVVDGHHRLLAMENLGEKTIPADVLTVDEAALRYGLTDFATLIEIGRQSGYYKGDYSPVEGGALERAQDAARMFLETNFPNYKKSNE